MTEHTIHAADVTPQSLSSLGDWVGSRGSGEEVRVGVTHLLAALEAGHDVTLTIQPNHHEIDMDQIAAKIIAAGHYAIVEQTGGSVATIFAGRTHLDEDGVTRYQQLAGPGHYTWGHGPNTSHTEEFGWGPDDDGEGPFIEAEAGDDEASIARKIVAVLTDLNTREG
jgi:hypothetical protein